MEKQKFQINGAHCPACKKLIERRISRINGINSVTVTFETGQTEIASERVITKDELRTALEGTEYQLV